MSKEELNTNEKIMDLLDCEDIPDGQFLLVRDLFYMSKPGFAFSEQQENKINQLWSTYIDV